MEDGWGRKIMGEGRVERVHCWGIREVARGKKHFLSDEGRATKEEIWVERDKGRVEGGEAIEMLREKSGTKIRYWREGKKWRKRDEGNEGRGSRGEGRKMRGWERRENRLFCHCLLSSKDGIYNNELWNIAAVHQEQNNRPKKKSVKILIVMLLYEIKYVITSFYTLIFDPHRYSTSSYLI